MLGYSEPRGFELQTLFTTFRRANHLTMKVFDDSEIKVIPANNQPYRSGKLLALNLKISAQQAEKQTERHYEFPSAMKIYYTL